ncbi:hypothetical protein C1646_819145 [Rhizophagus diaphanus]|nr:hypothetical protein C1646_819145 [Rhizophagus diaphanus] [Rhizophagus sp. MUCL 43196]
METYEITFKEKIPLYYSSQKIFSEETEEEFVTSFDKLSELEIFEFNERNYINMQNALEQEVVDYLSDENKEEFGIYEDQEVPPPPVEDANEPVYKLNPAIHTNFSPCILVDYLDNKLQTCGQTKNVRNICQLVETWQIDENTVSEYQSKEIPLGTTFPDQIIATSIECLENCFPNRILRIEAIFLQDVISVQKSNKVGRRKLGITRWKPTDQKKKTKLASIVVINKDGPPIKKLRQARRKTKSEEKSLLELLVTCFEYPNDEQIE